MLALKKAAVLFVLIGGAVLFTACPSQTNIAKINSNPDRYRGKEAVSYTHLTLPTNRKV